MVLGNIPHDLGSRVRFSYDLRSRSTIVVSCKCSSSFTIRLSIFKFAGRYRIAHMVYRYWAIFQATLMPRPRSNTVFSCKYISVLMLQTLQVHRSHDVVGTGQHFVWSKLTKWVFAMVYHLLKSSYSCFCCRCHLLTFYKINFKIFLRNTIRSSVKAVCKGYIMTTEVTASKERVKGVVGETEVGEFS